MQTNQTNNNKLSGKVAIVTGASKGIGASIAKHLAAEGQVEAQTPLGRIGQPQDIATAAVFLASSDSAWITGENLVIAGGYR